MFVYIVGAKWAMCGWWWWQWLDAGKVGIIISLTLNKWPSRVWRDPELRSGFGTGRGFLRGTASCCPPPERKNFRITHLCAIFKLTIVNFAIVGCLAFLFFTFLLSIMRAGNKTKRKMNTTTLTKRTKFYKYINLTACLLEIHFF